MNKLKDSHVFNQALQAHLLIGIVVCWPGGPLHVGDIETLPDASLCVRCPWHSWCFDLNTGEAKRPKHPEILATVYPTQVAPDGSLRVGFKEFDQSYFKELDS